MSLLEQLLQATSAFASVCTGAATLAATLLMAAATVALALETRETRVRANRDATRLAFRGTILEIAENISNLHGWRPQLEPTPSTMWLTQRLKFDSLSQLLAQVPIDPRIWQRSIAIARNLTAAELDLKTRLVPQDLEMAKVYLYKIDLYLKQLARYVAISMEKAGFDRNEASALLDPAILRPLAWAYGDTSLSPEAVAAGMEVQPITPYSELPSEPDDTGYASASLAQLVAEAHARLEKPLL